MKQRLIQGAGFGVVAAAIGLVVWSLGGFRPDTNAGPAWCPPGQYQSFGAASCSPVPSDPAGAPLGREYRVGVNMPAGAYVTNDIDPDWGCYWERLSGPHGRPESILQTGYAEPRSDVPVSVFIEPTDLRFYSEGCGDWHPGEGK